jgi:hypothetical protein
MKLIKLKTLKNCNLKKINHNRNHKVKDSVQDPKSLGLLLGLGSILVIRIGWPKIAETNWYWWSGTIWNPLMYSCETSILKLYNHFFFYKQPYGEGRQNFCHLIWRNKNEINKIKLGRIKQRKTQRRQGDQWCAMSLRAVIQGIEECITTAEDAFSIVKEIHTKGLTTSI